MRIFDTRLEAVYKMAKRTWSVLAIVWVALCTVRAVTQQTAVQPGVGASMNFRAARRLLEGAAPISRGTEETVHFRLSYDSLFILGKSQDQTIRGGHILSTVAVTDATVPVNAIADVSIASIPYRNGYPLSGHDVVHLSLKDGGNWRFYWIPGSGQTSASDFANALQWVVLHVDSEIARIIASREQFNQQAAAWRGAETKLLMPDAAHVHAVIAKGAIQEKNFDKAVDEYEAALDIFPTWPEGQFNVALICGETGDYDCAIEHAQDYLELVPNATDAQAVRDKVIIWQDKLKDGSK